MHYDRGVDWVKQARATWSTLAPYVDPERYRLTADFLAIQEKDAEWWRDASIAYFQIDLASAAARGRGGAAGHPGAL